MTTPPSFTTPREAVAAMVSAGAVFSVRRRDDSLEMAFTYRVTDGGNTQRCREILAIVKSKPAAFFQAFRAAVQDAAHDANPVGVVQTTPTLAAEGVVETTSSEEDVATSSITADEGGAETPPSVEVGSTTPISTTEGGAQTPPSPPASRNTGNSGKSPLPAPFCAPNVDCRGLPIPRETFAQMAVLQFGISIEEARAHANRVADEMMEGRRSSRRRRA